MDKNSVDPVHQKPADLDHNCFLLLQYIKGLEIWRKKYMHSVLFRLNMAINITWTVLCIEDTNKWSYTYLNARIVLSYP